MVRPPSPIRSLDDKHTLFLPLCTLPSPSLTQCGTPTPLRWSTPRPLPRRAAASPTPRTAASSLSASPVPFVSKSQIHPLKPQKASNVPKCQTLNKLKHIYLLVGFPSALIFKPDMRQIYGNCTQTSVRKPLAHKSQTNHLKHQKCQMPHEVRCFNLLVRLSSTFILKPSLCRKVLELCA